MVVVLVVVIVLLVVATHTIPHRVLIYLQQGANRAGQLNSSGEKLPPPPPPPPQPPPPQPPLPPPRVTPPQPAPSTPRRHRPCPRRSRPTRRGRVWSARESPSTVLYLYCVACGCTPCNVRVRPCRPQRREHYCIIVFFLRLNHRNEPQYPRRTLRLGMLHAQRQTRW